MSTAITLANLSPIERLKALDSIMGQHPILTLSEIPLATAPALTTHVLGDPGYHVVLSALAAIGAAFSATIKFHNFLYILDDRSVFRACEYLGAEFTMAFAEFSKKLEVLSLAGLIYRFNVAMKFGYPAQNIFQLRLNSWGRELVKLEELAHKPYYATIKTQLQKYIENHLDVYNEITAICDSPEQMIDIQRLHSLNSTLEIKVVT